MKNSVWHPCIRPLLFIQGRRNEFTSSGSKSYKLKIWVVPLHLIPKIFVVSLSLFQKSSGSMEPPEPPQRPALCCMIAFRYSSKVDNWRSLRSIGDFWDFLRPWEILEDPYNFVEIFKDFADCLKPHQGFVDSETKQTKEDGANFCTLIFVKLNNQERLTRGE